ncbi:stage V sporulation protein AA [Brassicibacter mesophilus]|uniref:stage V sporulation protein AA n=1 Tax=Brassicibacter mesophilus TaxID=745119 RepID=UPI003D2522FB
MIEKVKLFLQIEPKITATPGQVLKIEDVGTVFCIDENVQNSVLKLEVKKVRFDQKNEVIPVLMIISIIQNSMTNVDVVIMGNPEILVDIKHESNSNQIYKYLKVAIVCLILFLGAGLAIINFHADVNMDESLKIIYYMVTGKENDKPLILQIPYSIGIGLGMAVFFNHVLKKKWKKEPSPLEVEMYMYDKSIDEYTLDNTKHN